ncbi:RHS repeat-associated core domain-containing protein [Nocardiopsis alkaliphila]|uniref:RHS repeat-associated core domain-containing protein n=1 Tax=Nocardiopsis alkaliphila TaxID=225762 RepID=UPI00373AED44
MDGMIDASTGLTQLGARAYDADLGRFISVDPLMDLTDAQTMNGYVYSNNSPAVFTDPSGLSWHPARGYAPMPGHSSESSKHPARGYAPMPNYGRSPSWHPARGYAPPPPSVRRAHNSLIRNNTRSSPPAQSPPLVNATVSSEEQSIWESAWNGVSSWANDRYRTDDGGWNVGNIIDDVMLVGGLLCAACAVVAAAWSVGHGIWKISNGDSVNGVWDIAGAIVPGAAGKVVSRGGKFAAGVRHSTRVTNNPKGVPNSGRKNRRARSKSAARERSDIAASERYGVRTDSVTGYSMAANSAGVAMVDPSSDNSTWHRW